MTEKLYYSDSHLTEFIAIVLSCEPTKNGYALTLDKTAFFPEGGGQSADTGYIGSARITDVQERSGEILHYSAEPVDPGKEYTCRVDRQQRLRRMQNHSGEHIVSGLVHSTYGFDNVGFHMGRECMTIDFSGELTWDQLTEIETRANEAVRANVPIVCEFPNEKTLSEMNYRSKLELTENVRIVTVEGIDRCACCAPHVSRTGEIGIIKLLSVQRHRGGVRVELVCGMDALDRIRVMQENVTGISGLLSAKRHETCAAVERLLSEQQSMKERFASVSLELSRARAAAYLPTDGDICVFESVLDDIACRELVNMLAEKCRIAACFFGNDESGYNYIIGSRRVDLKAASKEINAAINGRGGGKSAMITGRAFGTRAQIECFFSR